MAEICPVCGLPKELCVCEEIARDQQKIRIYSERRRYGKMVTIVEGIKDVDINELAKKLKTKCASGGTVKNGNIELQGDHIKKVKKALEEIGFDAAIR